MLFQKSGTGMNGAEFKHAWGGVAIVQGLRSGKPQQIMLDLVLQPLVTIFPKHLRKLKNSLGKIIQI